MKKLILLPLLLLPINCFASGIFGGSFDASQDQSISGSWTFTSTATFTSTTTVNRIQFGIDEITIPDSGDANPAAYTLVPVYSINYLTCNDANNCAITLSEGTGGTEYQGSMITLFHAGGTGFNTITDVGGVQDTGGARTMSNGDNITLIHIGGYWRATSYQDN